VQAHVLGPPKDTKLLLRSKPRRGEVYLLGENDELGAYLAAAIQLEKGRDSFDADETKAFEMAMPFDGRHFNGLSKMEPPHGTVGAGYFLARDGWRRIDRDWLGAAEQLALKLDSDTNNTSLVLAFVVGTGADRRVLLFPGSSTSGRVARNGTIPTPSTSRNYSRRPCSTRSATMRVTTRRCAPMGWSS
jgi:hypothetical protein